MQPQAQEFAAWFVPRTTAAPPNPDLEAAEDGSDAEDEEDVPDVAMQPLALLATADGKRPWMPKLLDLPDGDLIFQHMETTYAVDYRPSGGVPIVRLYGTTAEGQSIVVWTDTFKPYFYARISSADEMQRIRLALEDMFARTDKGAVARRKQQFRRQQKRREYCRSRGIDNSEEEDEEGEEQADRSREQFVLLTERVEKRSMCGWHRNRPLDTMHRIVMAQPSQVKTARNSLEYANRAITDRPIETFEANVPFELRFMVDTRLAGCQWLKLPRGSFSTAPGGGERTYHFDHTAMVPIPVAEKGDLAPMRMLSFDIEAKRKRPGFCKGEEDPCVCICGAFDVLGTGIVHQVCFLFTETGGAATVLGADHVFIYRTESDMLLAFSQYIRESDPDAFTGWNICGFDWPYLVKRATALGIYDQFMRFARRQGKGAWLREQTFQSKAHGARRSNELLCDGRFNFDALVFMLRGEMTKYRSYKLNAISKEVLGDQKADVDHTLIPILHEGTDEDRARLLFYCLKDALLPLRILATRMAVINAVEQSRATGVPLKWLLERGQGTKTHSCILRVKEPWELMPSRSPKENGVYTGGGHVRKPIAGHYCYPLATLDYSSLYPSIMQAFNMCYSTLESLEWARAHMSPDDYWIPPPAEAGATVDHCYVKKHVREGVLPRMLTSLLAQRAYVKGLMKKVDKTKDKVLYDVLDKRQNALKVVCNSVYGFTKAFILSSLRIMADVCAWGREMIRASAAIIEKHFRQNSIVDREACARLGLAFEIVDSPDGVDRRPRKLYDARIIYGDTDSVVIDFGDAPLQDICAYARKAAALCTAEMQPPNSLAFESIKLRSMFFKPKMYASLEIVAGDIQPHFIMADAVAKAKVSDKGVLSKRRDNALIGSETQMRLFEYILEEDDVQGAFDYVVSVIRDLMMNRIDMSKLIITKGLSKTREQYEKGGMKQGHTELQRRIEKRAPYTGEQVPETGDRVPFIMKAGLEKEKACELSEDPLYAQTNGIPINTRYYLKKQIMAATLRVFTCVWEPEKLPLIKSDTKKASLLQLKAYCLLFAPKLPHMLQQVVPRARDFGIASHATVLPTCAQLGCGVRLTPRDRSAVVCDSHEREAAHFALERKHADLATLNKAAWDRCRACAGTGFDERHCSNITCDNFYARRRTAIDVQDIEDVLARFDAPEREPPQVERVRRVIDKVAEAGGEEAWRAKLLAAKKQKRQRKKK